MMRRFLAILIAGLTATLVYADHIGYYGVYCNTESQWVYTNSVTAPTNCPNSAAHSFRADSIRLIRQSNTGDSLPTSTNSSIGAVDLPYINAYFSNTVYVGGGEITSSNIASWNELVNTTGLVAEIYSTGNASQQLTNQNTWYIIPIAQTKGLIGFTTNAAGGLTATAAANGRFGVKLSVSFSGGSNDEIEGGVFVDGTIQENLRASRQLSSGGDVGNMAIHGTAVITNGQDVTFRMRNVTGPNMAVVIEEANLTVNQFINTSADSISITENGGGVTVFTGLSDTPNNYTGNSNKQVRVNAGETALEFFDYSETDPVYSAAVAASITSGLTNNWTTAYLWGDHATNGYLTSETDPIFTNWLATNTYVQTETDPVYSAAVAASISAGDTNNWTTAYNWGDHATNGYLTSVAAFTGSGTTGTVTSAGGDAGKYLKADGTWDTPAGGGSFTNLFTGAGTTGSVTSVAGDAAKYLKGDGTWDTPAGGGAATNLSAVQARRTTAYTLTTGYVSVPLDATDEETDAAVIEHNNTTTSRIDAKEAGVYLLVYRGIVDNANAAGAVFSSRLYKNGTTLVAGSGESQTHDQGSNNDIPIALGRSVIATLAANDYVEVQYMASSIADAPVVSAGSILTVTKLEGVQGADGATGAPGADGDITWQGAWVTSTAYTENQAVENDGSSYVCISNHTSSASDEPGVGGSWATYWDTLASKGATGAAGPATQLRIDISIHPHNSDYKGDASATYVDVARFVWAGSTAMGTPSNMYANCWQAAGGTGKVRVYDLSNAKTVCEATGITSTSAGNIVNMGSISNVTAAQAVWQIQHAGDGAQANNISALSVDFQ